MTPEVNPLHRRLLSPLWFNPPIVLSIKLALLHYFVAIGDITLLDRFECPAMLSHAFLGIAVFSITQGTA
jgi:hypothetical protein